MSHLAAAHMFFSAFSQSDFFGKLIFLSLLSLSILCWIVLTYKVWLIIQVKKISNKFQSACFKKGDLFSMDIGQLPHPKYAEVPHPFAEIYLSLREKMVEILEKNRYFSEQGERTGIEPTYLSQADLELVGSYVSGTISKQMKHLEKNLFILPTIITLAPFLGLLGTVWGILLSFAALQQGMANSSAHVLGGISTALVTTVLGLVIAIPALISYNYLKYNLKTLSSDMEDFLYLLLSHVEIQYRKADLP